MEIRIRYFGNVDKVVKTEAGDWIDLRNRRDEPLERGSYREIPLGVAMELPEGYEAHVIPRSSTFGRFGILQANSVGLIDESYRGDGDEWALPVYATRDVHIPANTRLCQFRIVKKMPELTFIEVEMLPNPNRGGLGRGTGRKA